MENNYHRFEKLYRLINLYPDLERQFQEKVSRAEDSSQLQEIIDGILNSKLQVSLEPTEISEIQPFRKRFWNSLRCYAERGGEPDYAVGASSDAHKILVGFDELTPVGYFLILKEKYATELAELFIDEQYRGLGLSKKVMDYVLDTYPRNELYILVHKPNFVSKNLIQKYEFQPVCQESNNLIRFEWHD